MAEWIPVASSHIEAIAFDEADGVLGVRFTDGSEYEYDDFDAEQFDSFMRAPSKGAYFRDEIRGVYDHRRLK